MSVPSDSGSVHGRVNLALQIGLQCILGSFPEVQSSFWLCQQPAVRRCSRDREILRQQLRVVELSQWAQIKPVQREEPGPEPSSVQLRANDSETNPAQGSNQCFGGILLLLFVFSFNISVFLLLCVSQQFSLYNLF